MTSGLLVPYPPRRLDRSAPNRRRGEKPIMNTHSSLSIPRSSLLATLALASALSVPALAQDAQQPASTPQDTTATSSQQPAAVTSAPAPAKEGFWGRVNPFARKKWVKKQTDP